jgi:hypothetical protein
MIKNIELRRQNEINDISTYHELIKKSFDLMGIMDYKPRYIDIDYLNKKRIKLGKDIKIEFTAKEKKDLFAQIRNIVFDMSTNFLITFKKQKKKIDNKKTIMKIDEGDNKTNSNEKNMLINNDKDHIENNFNKNVSLIIKDLDLNNICNFNNDDIEMKIEENIKDKENSFSKVNLNTIHKECFDNENNKSISFSSEDKEEKYEEEENDEDSEDQEKEEDILSISKEEKQSMINNDIGSDYDNYNNSDNEITDVNQEEIIISRAGNENKKLNNNNNENNIDNSDLNDNHNENYDEKFTSKENKNEINGKYNTSSSDLDNINDDNNVQIKIFNDNEKYRETYNDNRYGNTNTNYNINNINYQNFKENNNEIITNKDKDNIFTTKFEMIAPKINNTKKLNLIPITFKETLNPKIFPWFLIKVGNFKTIEIFNFYKKTIKDENLFHKLILKNKANILENNNILIDSIPKKYKKANNNNILDNNNYNNLQGNINTINEENLNNLENIEIIDHTKYCYCRKETYPGEFMVGKKNK